MTARNMKRIEINIEKKELCVKLVIYKKNQELLDCIAISQIVLAEISEISRITIEHTLNL